MAFEWEYLYETPTRYLLRKKLSHDLSLEVNQESTNVCCEFVLFIEDEIVGWHEQFCESPGSAKVSAEKWVREFLQEVLDAI